MRFRCDRRRSVALLLPVIWALLVTAEPASADLQIEFLVDGSGSMWAPVRGKAKILMVAEALRALSADLPQEVALALRVYPSPGQVTGTSDPGLRVPLERDNRLRFTSELTGLNPKGKAPLDVHLKRALRDFPEGEETKLLILVCDGVDLYGKSFCGKNLFESLGNNVRLHVFSINVREASERDELNCLAEQLSGTVTHLNANKSLLRALQPICKRAYKEEVERQERVREELERQRALQSKTRLKVEFHNTLDPFFADSIQVTKCVLNDVEMPLPSKDPLVRGNSAMLMDNPMPEGKHSLTVQYKMQRGKGTVLSRESSLVVTVKEGKTSMVQCYPQGAVFHWTCHFKEKVMN